MSIQWRPQKDTDLDATGEYKKFKLVNTEPQPALQAPACLFYGEQTGYNLYDEIPEHLWFTCMTASETGKLGHSVHDAFKVWGHRALAPNLPAWRLILEIPLPQMCVLYTLQLQTITEGVVDQIWLTTQSLCRCLQWWAQVEDLPWKVEHIWNNLQVQAPTMNIL